MAIFNSYVSHYRRVSPRLPWLIRVYPHFPRGTSLLFVVDQAFQLMSSRHFRKAEILRSRAGAYGVCRGLSYVEPQIYQNTYGYTMGIDGYPLVN